jgi:hypothetical protein
MMTNHPFQRPHWTSSKPDRCIKPIKSLSKQRCQLKPENPVHRVYKCAWCGRTDFPSVEMKDRHEANDHGEGW